MDNMINNSKDHQNNETANIHDVTTYKCLDGMRSMNLMTEGPPYDTKSPYDHIVEMIRGLELEDDGITMNRKIKAIETDFCNIVKDENMLDESINYINLKALDDGETAIKFALLFSSRNFESLAMNETKVRSSMLKLLETNFLNADTFRMHDIDKLYNSITLLGEYYNRVRLADNSPITILGESLIGLLIHEMEGSQNVIGWKLAKLVLQQLTLNGNIMRARHPTEITQLLFHIRRHLVEQNQLTSKTKALLLMTLDLYYNHFVNLGAELEAFYTKYYVQQECDENTNTGNCNNQSWEQQQREETTQNDSHEFTDTRPTTKKWSEQVCEDSFNENEYPQDEFNTTTSDHNSNSAEQWSPHSPEKEYNNHQYLPRPLKHNRNEHRDSRDRLNHGLSQEQIREEDDQTKPLPRWRAPRFNRDDEQKNEYQRNRSRRASGNFEDDHQSVHSEGGIRLYSVKDRQRHSQEKMDRSSNYNFIANSNWDRQSQRDDRSERSYISNYEYGNGNVNNQRRGFRTYNNRPNYDKPPRFQKNRKLHQQQQQPHEHSLNNNKNFNENWRRTRTNSINSFCDDDEVRASTLPRPGKAHFENNIKSASFRRSQSPKHQHHKGNYNGRYENNEDVHHAYRGGRRFNPRRQRMQQRSPETPIDNWEPTESSPAKDGQEDHSELVRNARQTTKYMNYLSSKK